MLWGIDLGGTKIEGVVLPGETPEPISRLRVPTQQEHGYEFILAQIAGLIESLERESGQGRPARIGLGMPGTLGSDGRVKNSNTVCLIGERLDLDLADLLGCEIVAMNDANLFALAEARFGAAARVSGTVFGVILGTGVGGAIVDGGRVLAGLHGIAGEWGHNPMPGLPDEEAHECYCGKRGCIETVISGPAVERWYEARSGRHRPLIEIAVDPDPIACATIDRLCDCFGRAIATVVNVIDPAAIVIGGGVGNVERLYTDGLAAIRGWVFNDEFNALLTKPALGDSAGVFGAALLSQHPPRR